MSLLLLLGCAETVPDTGQPREDIELVLGDPVECRAPVELSWSSSTLPDPGERLSTDEHGAGGSVAVVDLDGDGALEIALGYRGFAGLYALEGAGVRELAWYPVDMASFALGQDGLLVASTPSERWSLGPEGLTREPLVLDLGYEAPPLLAPQRLLSGDLDQDGADELFVLVNRTDGHGDALLAPVGELAWAPAQNLPESSIHGNGFDATWLDWDQDGDLDLYVANDHGSTRVANQLYENVEGVLELATADCDCSLGIEAMGVDVGDLNRDGLADLFVTGASTNRLLLGDASGHFIDATASTGADTLVDADDMGWGGTFGDLDNDGWLDLFVPRGDLWDAELAEAVPDSVYETYVHVLHNQGGAFVERSLEWGFTARGSWRSSVVRDLNGDGVLDLLVTDVARSARLYLSEGCTEQAWLEVEAPVGARVEVQTATGAQTGWVTRQSSYAATTDAPVHFGLGLDGDVERLRVTLVDGTSYERGVPFEARRRVRLVLDD